MTNILNRYWFLLVGTLTPFTQLLANEEGGALSSGGGWIAPAIGLAMGLAVFSAAAAQGRIGAAYMEGASRNPGAEKVMKTPLILSLIFVETLVLFTVLISFMLIGKI